MITRHFCHLLSKLVDWGDLSAGPAQEVQHKCAEIGNSCYAMPFCTQYVWHNKNTVMLVEPTLESPNVIG